jgi:hypothetical protein
VGCGRTGDFFSSEKSPAVLRLEVSQPEQEVGVQLDSLNVLIG